MLIMVDHTHITIFISNSRIAAHVRLRIIYITSKVLAVVFTLSENTNSFHTNSWYNFMSNRISIRVEVNLRVVL